MTEQYLIAWSEQRRYRPESIRHEQAEQASAHLPKGSTVFMSDADMNALKAAFTVRFDEDLPRTETLMSVANIGYRMALRDMQKGAAQ